MTAEGGHGTAARRASQVTSNIPPASRRRPNDPLTPAQRGRGAGLGTPTADQRLKEAAYASSSASIAATSEAPSRIALRRIISVNQATSSG